MSMKYIRKAYNVPAKRGGRISFTDAEKTVHGTIVGSRYAHLRIRLDGSKSIGSYHPKWNIVYLPPTSDVSTDKT